MRKMDCQMYCCERVAVEAALRRTKPRSAVRLVIDDGRSHADMAHPYLRAFGTPIMNIPDGCWKTAIAVSILNACELMITVSASGYSKGNTEMAPDELRNSFQTFFQQATGKSTPAATSASDNLFQTITNDGTGIDNSRLQSTSLFDNLVSLHLLPFQAGESQCRRSSALGVRSRFQGC